MKNYYDILGLKPGASQEEIRKAYLKLAQEWHPDKHQSGDVATAEAKFKDISEAYENLKNGIGSSEDNRSRHFDSRSDIEEMMRNFARRAGFNFGFNPRQENFYEEIQVNITIENLYNEESIEVKITSFDESSVGACVECGGTGQKTTQSRQGNMLFTRSTVCSKCRGQGFTSTGPGTDKFFKVKPTIENLQFPLPLGRVGSYNPITRNYNSVVIRFVLQKSYNYAIVENGAGLMMTLPVLYEHLRDGKKLKIKIFGNNAVIDVPPKPSLQRMLVVPNKGMPLGNGQRGNLYIKLDIRWED